MVTQISSSQVVHHQIEIVFILKSLRNVDEKGIFKRSQEFFLIHYTVDAVLFDDPTYNKKHTFFLIFLSWQNLHLLFCRRLSKLDQNLQIRSDKWI